MKDLAGYINLVGSLIYNFVDGLHLKLFFTTGNSNDS